MLCTKAVAPRDSDFIGARLEKHHKTDLSSSHMERSINPNRRIDIYLVPNAHLTRGKQKTSSPVQGSFRGTPELCLPAYSDFTLMSPSTGSPTPWSKLGTAASPCTRQNDVSRARGTPDQKQIAPHKTLKRFDESTFSDTPSSVRS